MILGVDIGGTKTLIGVFDKSGKLKKTRRFPTPKSYADFLTKIKKDIFEVKVPLEMIVIAAPGRIDKKADKVISFGNLPWKNVQLAHDITELSGVKTIVENDAKLAALSESVKFSKKVDKVLYITFSTGIGSGLVYKGELDEAMLDSEAGQILLVNPDNNGQLSRWETFASGKALYEKYGQKASEIDSKSIWQKHSYKMALGIVDLCAVMEPDIVIIGGGVGAHFNKYGDLLKSNVLDLLPKMVKKPRIVGAKNAELASLLGCFEMYKSRANND